MYFQILIASRLYRIHQPNPTSLGKDQERAKVEMEKKHKEKVSQPQEFKEKEEQKKQKKMIKKCNDLMQNATDSAIKSQHNIPNDLQDISHFALNQYVQKIAFGIIAPPTSNEDSDQSPLKVIFSNYFIWFELYLKYVVKHNSANLSCCRKVRGSSLYCEAQARVRQGSARDGPWGERP